MRDGKQAHPIRIAILVREFPPHSIGGLEIQTYRIAREIHRRDGFEVSVITRSYDGSTQWDIPFNIVRIPHVSIRPGRGLSFKSLATAHLIRYADEYDILQCMQLNPYGFLGYLTHKWTGLPYFAWIRGGDFYYGKDKTLGRLKMSRVLNDTLVLTQTATTKQDVISEFPNANVGVLGNGVDVPQQTATGEDITFVGRLSERKSVDVLLRAVEGLNESVRIVGDGPERDRLESLAVELGVPAEFIGWVDPSDITEQLRKSRMLVLPSQHTEGMPNAALEAMSIGLPVIATDIGGTPGLINDGRTGLLVEPGSIEDLRTAIQRVCNNKDLQIELATNAREYVKENHRWPVIINKLCNLYVQLLDTDLKK